MGVGRLWVMGWRALRRGSILRFVRVCDVSKRVLVGMMSWCCQDQRWMFSRFHGELFWWKVLPRMAAQLGKTFYQPFSFLSITSFVTSSLLHFCSLIYFQKIFEQLSKTLYVKSSNFPFIKKESTDEDWWSTRQN